MDTKNQTQIQHHHIEFVGYLSIDFIVAKTNIHVWCWIRCSNILAQFSVPCLCGLVYAIFILL